MPRRCGRPAKDEPCVASREQIIEATGRIIEREGADAVTVRYVIGEAGISNGTFYHYFSNKDELMVSFLSGSNYESCELALPLSDIGGRVAELYARLAKRYGELGADFMKKFYTPSNRALAGFIDSGDSKSGVVSIVERSRREIQAAQDAGVLSAELSSGQMADDCCTIVKGCIFSWCLMDCLGDVAGDLARLLRNYFYRYLQSC